MVENKEVYGGRPPFPRAMQVLPALTACRLFSPIAEQGLLGRVYVNAKLEYYDSQYNLFPPKFRFEFLNH